MNSSTQLTKMLSAYSLFAGAFLAAEKSHAQIVYTDVVPDDTLYLGGTSFYLDLNNDGPFDFFLQGIDFGSNLKAWYIVTNGSNGKAFGGTGAHYAKHFNEGDSICSFSIYTNSNDYFSWLQGHGTLLHNSPYWTSQFAGGWSPGDHGFIALYLYDLNSNIYYGWLRLSIAQDVSFMVVEDYAYDNIMNECISAGEGIPLTISEIKSTPFQIYPNPSTDKIFLSGIKKERSDRQVSVFDLSGRKIFSQQISSGENSLDISSLTEGMYLLQLKNENEVLVKKFEVKR